MAEELSEKIKDISIYVCGEGFSQGKDFKNHTLIRRVL